MSRHPPPPAGSLADQCAFVVTVSDVGKLMMKEMRKRAGRDLAKYLRAGSFEVVTLAPQDGDIAFIAYFIPAEPDQQ